MILGNLIRSNPNITHMKKMTCFSVLILFTGISFCQVRSIANNDPDLIGGWEVFKAINDDGTEVRNSIAIEHYYECGKVIYVGMWIKPMPLDKFSDDPKVLSKAFKSGLTGLGTFESDKENGVIKFNIIASADSTAIGNKFEVSYKITGDTIIWGDKYYAVRIN